MGIFDSLFGTASSSSLKPVVLLILDGWGLAPDSPGNAITRAKTPNMDNLTSKYPHGQLLASGESVGLPAGEVGNTEVGHINMGAGRTVLQDLKRITKTIQDGTFFDNQALFNAIDHAKRHNSKLHIAGLIGSGHVHSSMDHFWALLEYARKQQFGNIFIHMFTDGRDTPPEEAKIVIRQLAARLTTLGFGHIATIAGRYYAMDRDRRWDRTEAIYKAMVQGVGIAETDPESAIAHAYSRGETDEFIKPIVMQSNGRPVATVDDDDSFIFFNFRIDRPRQLSMALTLSDFENSSFIFGAAGMTEQERANIKLKLGKTFVRGKVPKNLFFVTMTEYQKELPVSAVAFPPQKVETTLANVIATSNLKQLHMSESEKRRFVTYYFDGMQEAKIPGEEVVIVPSPTVATYDLKPEMSVHELANEFKKWLGKNQYSFIVMNFANPDMVAHTGNLAASIKAIENVDAALGVVSEAVLKMDGTLIVTADHGNAEELLTYPPNTYFFTSSVGAVNTDHSANPVPVIIANKMYEGKPVVLKQGILGDIAPTILTLLKLQIPTVMTGKNLLA
ncbi:MAG TPA: 2,3-bisphosphoglycerate-independent phosphoglycerate mutase [Patescibacteria group bacterium]